MTPADERRWRELVEALSASVRALVVSLNTIQDQIKAIAEHAQTKKDTGDAQPPSIIQVELQLPSAINEACKTYEHQQDRQERFEAESLDLGKRTHNLEKYKFWAEVVVAGLLLGTLVVTISQWRAMLESNKLTRISADAAAAQLELAQRPWVFTDMEITKPLSFDSNGAQMQVKLTTKNNGSSPAIGVWVSSEIYIPRLGHPDAIAKRTDVCGEVHPWGNISGWALIPKSPTPQEGFHALSAKREDLEEATRNPYSKGSFTVAIIVCTKYESSVVKHGRVSFPYFSNTAYQLFQVLPNKKVISDFQIGQDIPSKNLGFMAMLNGVSIR